MKNNTKKPTGVTILIIVCFLAFAAILAFRNKQNISVSVKPDQVVFDSTAGFRISFDAFNTAKLNWNNSHPGGTLGGSISKDSLISLINSMSPSNINISFYFGSDRSGRTFVMFAPAYANFDSKIYRNGAFCPTFCN